MSGNRSKLVVAVVLSLLCSVAAAQVARCGDPGTLVNGELRNCGIGPSRSGSGSAPSPRSTYQTPTPAPTQPSQPTYNGPTSQDVINIFQTFDRSMDQIKSNMNRRSSPVIDDDEDPAPAPSRPAAIARPKPVAPPPSMSPDNPFRASGNGSASADNPFKSSSSGDAISGKVLDNPFRAKTASGRRQIPVPSSCVEVISAVFVEVVPSSASEMYVDVTLQPSRGSAITWHNGPYREPYRDDPSRDVSSGLSDYCMEAQREPGWGELAGKGMMLFMIKAAKFLGKRLVDPNYQYTPADGAGVALGSRG